MHVGHPLPELELLLDDDDDAELDAAELVDREVVVDALLELDVELLVLDVVELCPPASETVALVPGDEHAKSASCAATRAPRAKPADRTCAMEA